MKITIHFSALAAIIAAAILLPVHAAPESQPQREIISAETAISILHDWETLKPGVSSRADLLKIFSRTGGGFADATRRSYAYKDCAYILIDVTFSLSQPKEAYKDSKTSYDGLPSDIISTISKPYIGFLAWD